MTYGVGIAFDAGAPSIPRIPGFRSVDIGGRACAMSACEGVPTVLAAMKSKVAEEAERALVEATQRLSPEERLSSFLVHSRLIMELLEAGRATSAAAKMPDFALLRRLTSK